MDVKTNDGIEENIMDNNKEKSKCNKKKHNKEIKDLKESYKLGKEYYKNVEKKIND